MKLLLLEDDDLLGESLAETLSDEGYRVDIATHLRVADSLMQTEEYGLVILDIGLPDGSGLDLLTRWRGRGYQHPVLALTARDTWEDKVNGLRRGADDYLTKPFHEEELLARLHALLRRQHGNTGKILIVNGIHLDEHQQHVSTDGITWQPLTGTEFRLLRYLMHNPDRVHSKLRLLDQLYTLEQDAPAPNLVEVYIRRLRRLLGQDVIKTRRGQGYIFASS
ncbi:response regulator [Halomonas elongata]|uniref:Response regulator n=1 Tax=Halomonas elongata (strain ATCC 33173 / DSM 2581 / NBRC 15536 / NCIMB 2198 / 1H9) TaxID=768066 RepID=E1V8X5_HALED|nr:response regulator [Halomonas elongata]WBF18990.1 response regulator [Halomonas elongata]WPU47850.1 response regulator [Halomonas elongata DSM 2581]CBV41750.1 response regulator/HTH domain transcription regulator [Halomonas elongata DSM 2581]